MKRIWERLRQRAAREYHVNVFNQETFEQRADFNIKLGRVWFLVTLGCVLLVATTVVLIFFTGIREYIPGYTDSSQKNKLEALLQRQRQLERQIIAQDSLIKSTQRSLGVEAPDTAARDRYLADALNQQPTEALTEPSRPTEAPSAQPAVDESAQAFTRQSPIAAAEARRPRSLVVQLMNPVSGFLTRGYDASTEHYGVDLVAPANSLVRAVANGTVIFSDFTLKTGYVVGIRHTNHGPRRVPGHAVASRGRRLTTLSSRLT